MVASQNMPIEFCAPRDTALLDWPINIKKISAKFGPSTIELREIRWFFLSQEENLIGRFTQFRKSWFVQKSYSKINQDIIWNLALQKVMKSSEKLSPSIRKLISSNINAETPEAVTRMCFVKLLLWKTCQNL